MARVRGSSRKAPPSRSSRYGVTKSSQKTDNNVISRSADSRFLEQQCLVDQMASSLIPGGKRRVDSAAPDTPQEEDREIPPEAHSYIDGPEITTGSHPVPQRRRRHSSNPGQFHPDASAEQYMMGEPSWKSLGAAPNEANEVRRMKVYQEQQALEYKERESCLRFSNFKNKTLLTHWSLSIRTDVEVMWPPLPQSSASVPKPQDQLLLMGHGNSVPPPLSPAPSSPEISPVFPIASPRDGSASPELLHLGTHPLGKLSISHKDQPLTTLDLEFPLDDGRPPHVPFPRFTRNPKIDRSLPQEGQDYARRSNKRLGYHILPLQRGRKEEMGEEMSLGEMEKYLDFDAGP